MRIDDLEARKIVLFVLGERGVLKSDEELAQVLKKRLTKKERFALNAKVSNDSLEATMQALNVDEMRLEAIIKGAVKKIQNESVHKEFYAVK